MAFFVYLLRCSDGSYYVGHTDDVEARLASHQQGLVPGYTRSRRPLILEWFDETSTREEAIAVERQLKGWSRAKKEALAAGGWPALRALVGSPQTSEVQDSDSP